MITKLFRNYNTCSSNHVNRHVSIHRLSCYRQQLMLLPHNHLFAILSTTMVIFSFFSTNHEYSGVGKCIILFREGSAIGSIWDSCRITYSSRRMTLEEMSLSKPNQSESLNSGSSLHEWSQFERHHFLTALPSVDIVSFEGLKPEISERIFELISEGLAKENIMKTPQEDQCLYQQYKANFEDNKYDGRLAEHRWEAIARNLEARGFQRRTRVACASHWAVKRN